MTTRSHKRVAGMALSLVTLLAAGMAQADERAIWMRIAGALLQDVERTAVASDEMTGIPASKSAILGNAWGNLGRADITGLALEVAALPPAPDPACPDGFFKVAEIVENNIVLTFSDFSLLYGEGSGVVCVNFLNAEIFAPIDGHWTGGTQRFRDAGGDWSIRIDEAVQVGDAASVLAETGILKGTLIR